MVIPCTEFIIMTKFIEKCSIGYLVAKRARMEYLEEEIKKEPTSCDRWLPIKEPMGVAGSRELA